MDKLERAKKIIKENYNCGCYGIFNTPNWTGDIMAELYNDGELKIDICYGYSYFEVFGLADSDFRQLEDFYYSLDSEPLRGNEK